MKTRNKSVFAFLSLMLTFILILSGCGASKDSADNKENSKDKDSEKSTAYTVDHAMGTTEIPKTPEKIVILTNEGTEALLAMGVTPVGAVKSWAPEGKTWYDHIADKMKDVEVVGTESEPNIEAIAALEPDLIIGNKMRQEKYYEQLKAIAPTVFAEDLRGDWKINFELYSKAIHKEEKGKQILADFNSRVGKLKEKVDPDTEVSVVRFMTGKTRIYYTDTFSGVIFDQIGFKRPQKQIDLFAKDPENKFALEVGKEQIPDMDGDIIFYFTYETGDGKATEAEKEWTNDPLWKNLDAVKAGKAYKVSDPIWNTAGGVLAANLMLDDLEKFFK